MESNKLREYQALVSITKQPSIPMISQVSKKCVKNVIGEEVDLIFIDDGVNGVYRLRESVTGGADTKDPVSSTVTVDLDDDPAVLIID